MAKMSAALTEALRQRIMHRTSVVESLAYQYGITMAEAEARYDADTATLEETGVLPALPPSPNVSGTDAPHDEPDVEAEAAADLAPETDAEPDPAPESDPEPDPAPESDPAPKGGGTDG